MGDVKRNELFVLTTGEYSDYGVQAILRARKDFDFDAVMKAFVSRDETPEHSRTFFETKFVQHLIDSGLAREEPCIFLHISDYGRPHTDCEAEARKQIAEAEQRERDRAQAKHDRRST